MFDFFYYGITRFLISLAIVVSQTSIEREEIIHFKILVLFSKKTYVFIEFYKSVFMWNWTNLILVAFTLILINIFNIIALSVIQFTEYVPSIENDSHLNDTDIMIST